MTTAWWIGLILLTPFWWGMGWLTLALVADLLPPLRHRVFALLNRMERTRYAEPIDVPKRIAA